VVIIVGTHLDQIARPDHVALTERYQQLICRCFSSEHCEDLPSYWPKIAGIHFVGLVEQRFLTQDLNIDELRKNIYDTALNLKLPLGMCALVCICEPNFQKGSSAQIQFYVLGRA